MSYTKTCSNCYGKGKVKCHDPKVPLQKCTKCHGTGWKVCKPCNGTGKV